MGADAYKAIAVDLPLRIIDTVQVTINIVIAILVRKVTLLVTILDWAFRLSPLLIATCHGYGAAWLAVKMIFRPHEAVYVFGKRLPFTPGMLPKERVVFIDAFSRVIAERLLTVETITDELMQLGLEAEIETIAKQQYHATSQRTDVMDTLVFHLRQSLERLRSNSEIKQQLAVQLRDIIDREILHEYGMVRRTVANFFIEMPFIRKIVDASLHELITQVEASLYVRETIESTMLHLPEAVFKDGGPDSNIALTKLVSTLSTRLNFYDILKRRLSGFSNEMIEDLIMETAGHEIKGIVWFGALIGLFVGIFQSLLMFLK
ncbi:MAG TPA: DUF445 family protein [Blastocatellia bacterium]|nr:DUF445 family protein [Blastocatellia bacterium]